MTFLLLLPWNDKIVAKGDSSIILEAITDEKLREDARIFMDSAQVEDQKALCGSEGAIQYWILRQT